MDDFFSPTKFGKRNPVNRPIASNKRVDSKKEFRESIDQVKLSQISKNKSPDKNKKPPSTEIRQDLVKKYRRDLDKGVYEIRAEEIADKIVQRIRDEKDRIIF